MLAEREIALIEDDAYGELYFGAKKPLPAKAFDTQGLVMHCGSFSKCLAPGYRVGWVAGGRFARKIEQLRLMYTLSPAIPSEAAIAAYLNQGGFDRHLRRMRSALIGYQAVCGQRRCRTVSRGHPGDSAVPRGGYSYGSNCRKLWTRSNSTHRPASDALASHRGRCFQPTGASRIA